MKLEEALNRILELEEAGRLKDEEIASLNILTQEAEQKLTEQVDEINKLRENNMSLFLKVSQDTAPQQQQQTPEPETPAVQDWDDFMAGW